MKLKMFSIYDSKVEAYMSPFFGQSLGHGIRIFEDLCNEPTHPIGKYYADVSLFHIGEFDDQTSVVTPAKANALLVNGIEAHKQLNLSLGDNDI